MPRPVYTADPSGIQEVANGPAGLRGWHIHNGTAAPMFVQFFDVAQAADVTLGTTPPDFVLAVQETSSIEAAWPDRAGPVGFTRGLCYAVTTENDNDTAPTYTTGPATGDVTLFLD